jgi:two-component system response regulator ChvI
MRIDSASTRPSAARSFAAGQGAVPRVLVAHTSKSLRQLVKLQLVCAGYEVTVAEDAIDAGRQALRQPPDLIVMDIELPALEGLEFMLSHAGLPLIPVIFLTQRQDALERATRLGAAACLTTPLSTSRLLETVARCLASQSEARAGYRTPHDASANPAAR